MKKIVTVFDLQPGNYGLLGSVLGILNTRLDKDDKVYLMVQPKAKQVYEKQIYKKLIQNIKPVYQFQNYIFDSDKDFGQNIQQIVKKDQGQLYIFKTTLPIIYYKNVFDFDFGKDFKQNWFVLPSHDVVTVPNRKGKIMKMNDNLFLSQKQQQRIANVQRPIHQYEPDFFVFGKQFIQTVLMINDFKQNNFAFIVQRAIQLKQPVKLQGKFVIKKYWNTVLNNSTYCLIPQYMMPIVKQIKEDKLIIQKVPTIVGNKYFKNSGWFSQIISRIKDVIFTKDDGVTSITGDEALSRVAVRFDMDINRAMYVAKFLKQLTRLKQDMVIDFYTKNIMIKPLYEEVLDQKILSKISWMDTTKFNYQNLRNIFDYIKTQYIFKFDLNFFNLRNADLNVAISDTLSLPEPFTNKDTVCKQIQPKDTQTILISTIASPQFMDSGSFFNRFLRNQKYKDFKKIKLILQPIPLPFPTPQQVQKKTQERFQLCQKKRKQRLNGWQVQIIRATYKDQVQLLQNMLYFATNYKTFYVSGKNFISTLALNLNREVQFRGNQ